MASKRFDINTACSADLAKLAGIGKNKAQAIIKHRKGKGPFRSVQDLQSVPGIGPNIIDSNRHLLICLPPTRRPRQCICHLITPHSARVTRSQAAIVAARASSVATPVASGSRRRPRTRSSLRAAALSREAEGLEEDLQWGDATAPPALLGCPVHGFQDGLHTQDDMDLLNYDDSRSNEPAIARDDDETEDEEDADDEDESEEEEEEEKEEEGEEEEAVGGEWEDGEGDRLQNASTRRCYHFVRLSGSGQSSQGQRKRGRESPPVSGEKRPCRMFPQDCQGNRSSCGPGSSRKLNPRPQTSPLSNLRNRIPSKDHPPPGLADWLNIFKDWSNAERLMAIDELIAQCRPTQVRHMMAVIEPQFQRDFISLLPKELALYVLSFLEPKDLLRAAQTCRYWRLLAEDNLLWREKCREENVEMTRRRDRLWKNAYMRQYAIEQNWRSRPIRPPKALKGHDDHVITCLEFCGNRIVSGSDDNTLKVWSVVSGKCLRTLTGHTGGVWSSQMSGTTVISGSTDRTLKVWNSETGLCRYTLYGHTSTVRCMSLYKNKVVSGSRDATLRVWDIDTGHCLHVLQGHVAAVRCVQYDGRRVVSGAYDYTVRVWDPETETCLHTLQGHTNRVYSLQFDGVHVVSGSLDTSIKVWDVEAGTLLHTLIGHQSLTSGLELQDNILVSGNADSTVKVWDITTGQCLQTLQGPNKHQSAVTCLQFSKKFVITSSDDGTVKIWDLKTGEFLRNLVALESGGSGGVVWRLRCSNTKLVCAVGSRNGTEETKLLVLDFDVDERRT